MTALGRMGLVGVAALLLIYLAQFRITLRTARAARQDSARQDALTLQAACWVVLVSSCFGVVLEGPMGAIPFWIMLGLAHHDATREPAPASPPADQAPAAETEDLPNETPAIHQASHPSRSPL
jgi:O-antigen ligase